MWQRDKEREVIGLDTKELLTLQANMLEIEIHDLKEDLIDRIYGLSLALTQTRVRLEGTLDDSRIAGIDLTNNIQRYAHEMELRIVKITAKAKHLMNLRQIISEDKS